MSAGPEGLPTGQDLDALLEDLAGALGPDESAPPPLPPSAPWPAWLAWAIAGALGCAIAGAVAAGNEWTGSGFLSTHAGLAAWQWWGLHGALVGAQGGLACFVWERVRAGRLKKAAGVLLILVLSAGVLLVAGRVLDLLAALLRDDRTLLPGWASLPQSFTFNLRFGCCLLAALLSHVGTKSLAGRLFLSWVLCVGFCLPIVLAEKVLWGYGASLDFFWRVAFPYYLALPLSWWVLARFRPNPLPVLEEEPG